MLSGSRIGFGGAALVAAMLTVFGCGGGSDRTGAEEPMSSPPPPPRAVVAHRIGPGRVEPGEQHLPARPCSQIGSNGTATVFIYSDNSPCVRVKPGEQLRVVNDTGIGPAHKGAKTIRVRIGDYQLRIEPRGSGLVRPPAETYLGRGAHLVQTTGGRGATILLLPAVCAMRPPVAPGEEPCFR